MTPKRAVVIRRAGPEQVSAASKKHVKEFLSELTSLGAGPCLMLMMDAMPCMHAQSQTHVPSATCTRARRKCHASSI